MNQLLHQQESLHVKQQESEIDWVVIPAAQDEELLPTGDWQRYRQQLGAMNRVPKDFFKCVWRLMKQCKGVVIGDKLERRNRLDSEVMLAEMTPVPFH